MTATVDPARFIEWKGAAIPAAVVAFPFTRVISEVHLHHTYVPNHASWKGRDSVVAMWNFHVNQNGWADIAQHVTVAPDGGVWRCRDWNIAPASNSGDNGNNVRGPMMIEMAGNFDTGHDTLGGAQYEAVKLFITAVNARFWLAPSTLKFHRQLGSPKTCPGSGVDYSTVVADLLAYRNTHP